MTRALVLAALAAVGLSGCDQVQHYADLAVAVAPVVNSTVQSYAVLNDATLSAIADANRSDPKLQAAIANIRKGNAITASSATGINGGTGFIANDVGRLIRLQDSAKWGWAIITARSSSMVVTATVQAMVPGGADGAFDGTGATANWQLGAWSVTTGWPFIAAFFQQRLAFCGTQYQPNRLDASTSGGFSSTSITMSPSADDGTVADTSALSFIISGRQSNTVTRPAGADSDFFRLLVV